MKNNFKLENPGLVHAISFINESKDAKEITTSLQKYIKKTLGSDSITKIPVTKDLMLRFKIVKEIDYMTIEVWFVSVNNTYKIENDKLLAMYNALNLDLSIPFKKYEIFNSVQYVISANDLTGKVSHTDTLLYNIFYKKVDEVRYLFSTEKENEFLVNFLKHIIKFDIYYAKINRFYQKFTAEYPFIRKSNEQLINECSELLSWVKEEVSGKTMTKLNKRINDLEAVNFAISYDIESLESNLDNLTSRLKTIGWENSRYFQNHVEKWKFVINAFERVQNKNSLIKENILNNSLKFVQNIIEQEKLKQESKKINHIKNIKEILGWLAFIEIFIKWLWESSKIFSLWETLSAVLSNTNFMRMSFIIIFVLGYFSWYFSKKFIRFIKSK